MEIRSLHSRFARRIFLLFFLAALLPVLALYGLVYVGVSDQLESQSARALEESAKNRGMGSVAAPPDNETRIGIAKATAGISCGKKQ